MFAEYWQLGNMTGTVRKHTPSLEAFQVLYQRMKYEYDFYYFIQDQFHLKKKIGLKSQSCPTHTLQFLQASQLKSEQPVTEVEEGENN
ncbi:UNVERIFIED_CONTAM: hypothetical protein FKN15_045026 [Acipenser sinensis]